MTECNFKGLLKTIQEDKQKVLKGLYEQDQHRAYTTTEVIAMLELSFALVEASIVTRIEEEVSDRRPKISPQKASEK
mgnify:CR=1 FL=1